MLGPLVKLPRNAKVGVIGGGVSGLTFTYFLSKLRPDVKITIFNQESRAGGWINSWNTKDKNQNPVMIERGPRTLRGVSDGTVLITDTLLDLKKGDLIRSIAKDSAADRKFLVDPQDKLVQVPNSISSFLKFAFNPLSKGLFSGMIWEWTKKPIDPSIKDESVASLLSRRYGGPNLSQNLFSAIYRGIYADDVRTLSAEKIVGKLYYDERKYGSITKGCFLRWKANLFKTVEETNKLSECVSLYGKVFNKKHDQLQKLAKKLAGFPMLGLKGGLQQFPNALKDAIAKSSNVKIMTDKVTSFKQSGNLQKVIVDYKSDQKTSKSLMAEFDHLRIAIAPNNLSELIRKSDPTLQEKLNKIKTNTVTLVNLYISTKDIIPKRLNGFGYLIPESNKNPENVLGVIFDSVIEKNFKPFLNSASKTNDTVPQDYTKLTAMVGGHLFNDADGKQQVPNEQDTIRCVKDALKKHLGATEEDLNDGQWIYTVAKDCLPQFEVGYNELARSIEQDILIDYFSKVSLGGMGFSKGPGIPDVVSDAFRDAVKLK